jgi:outer membrane lipoprotein-sorting protein
MTARAGLTQALTLDQIIEKNVAARGGLKAWRDIQGMRLTGKMDAGGKGNVQLPFTMELKRPRMSRLEIQFAGSKAIQVYDGTRGWKVRPFLGRVQVEQFTPEELQIAAEQGELDGLLIDHDAKGIKVAFLGVEQVEGHNAYKLRLILKNGQSRNLWVDAQSFLEVKVEGYPRKLNGRLRKVETYYRNYQRVGGLMVPFVLETAVEKFNPTRKITFENVLLNPKLEDSAFARPDVSGIKPVGAPLPSAAPVRPGR